MTDTDSANLGRRGEASAPFLCALPQLIDPHAYTPCDWDLLVDHAGRAHWLDLFDAHFAAIKASALVSGYREHDIDAAWHEINAWIDRLRADPRAAGDTLDILTLDRIRDGALRRNGVPDPFASVKQGANDAAIAQLADRLETIDRTPEDRRLEELARGMFAGNLFDMGAPQTAARFHDNAAIHFDELLGDVTPRPWLHDGVDGATLNSKRKAVIFVDNAGGDVALGVLPLAKQLLEHGSEVILAASKEPVLNDVTAEELSELRKRVEAIDSTFADPRLQVISTGTDTPLIDLSEINPELCEAATDADLLILVGMGRALESNWLAGFTCESWRVATIKEHGIAKRRGGVIYDCVFRVEPPARSD
jgi:type II pantothenate kinase